MKNSSQRRRKQARHRLQMKLAFPTKGPLDAGERLEIIGLLSRLLLRVANANTVSEVRHDAS